MSTSILNEGFNKKYFKNNSLNESFIEDDELYNALMSGKTQVDSMGLTGLPALKQYEFKFQEILESFYPGLSWWDITDCNIFMELFQTQDPEGVINCILDGLKVGEPGEVDYESEDYIVESTLTPTEPVCAVCGKPVGHCEKHKGKKKKGPKKTLLQKDCEDGNCYDGIKESFKSKKSSRRLNEATTDTTRKWMKKLNTLLDEAEEQGMSHDVRVQIEKCTMSMLRGYKYPHSMHESFDDDDFGAWSDDYAETYIQVAPKAEDEHEDCHTTTCSFDFKWCDDYDPDVLTDYIDEALYKMGCDWSGYLDLEDDDAYNYTERPFMSN